MSELVRCAAEDHLNDEVPIACDFTRFSVAESCTNPQRTLPGAVANGSLGFTRLSALVVGQSLQETLEGTGAEGFMPYPCTDEST